MANEVRIRVTAEDKTGPAIDSATKKVKGLSETLKQVGTVAAGVLTANAIQAGAQRVVAFAQSTVKAATDLGESVNAVSRIFDSEAQRVIQWGKDNAAAFGLSQRAFNQAVVPLGAMLKNTGMSMSQVADETIGLTERAADMASVFNVDVSQAMFAIQAALRGETEPIRAFGVSLSEAAIQERALADSGKAAASELTNQEKAAARLALIYEQTADVAGDFAATSDGLANAQRIATAQIEDAKAKMGAAFTGILAKAAVATGALAEAFSSMSQPAQLAIAVTAAAGAAFVILVPKVLAAKTALDQMAASNSKIQQGMGKAAKAAVVLGSAFAALQVVSLGLDLVFGEKVAPDVEAAAKGLEEFSKDGKLAGESARVLGHNVDDLRLAFHRAAGAGILLKDSGATDTIRTLDEVLAHLVSSGNAAAATKVLEMITDPLLSIEQIKAQLPSYAAALEKTVVKTAEVAEATEEATEVIAESWEAAYSDFIDLEGAFESALDKLAEKQKLTSKDIIRELEEQVRAQERWADDMILLATRVPKEMLDELAQIGPKGAGLVRQLASMSNKEMGRVIAAWQRGGSLSGQSFGNELNRKIASVILPAARGAAAAITRIFNQAFGNATAAASNAPRSIGGQRSFASGGISSAMTGGARSGRVWVGETGPELVDLPTGSKVYPSGQSQVMAGQMGETAVRVILDIRGGDDEFDRWFRKRVQVIGGGDVNKAFGRAPTWQLADR